MRKKEKKKTMESEENRRGKLFKKTKITKTRREKAQPKGNGDDDGDALGEKGLSSRSPQDKSILFSRNFRQIYGL